MFLEILEEQVLALPRLPVDDRISTAYVIDGMAVVQMMKNAGSATFGELANKYFQLITAHLGNNGCNRVDVVFDRYNKEDSKRKQSVLEGDHHQALRCEYRAHPLQFPRSGKTSSPTL